MKKNIAVLLASGVEEAELFITIDVLKRLNLNVNLISVNQIHDNLKIKTNNQNIIISNSYIDQFSNLEKFDSIFIPGGLKSVETILKNKKLLSMIKQEFDQNKIIAAICAAPLILDTFNDKSLNFTIYPTLNNRLINKDKYINEKVVINNNVITGNGVGNTFAFAFAFAELIIKDKVKITNLMDKMLYTKDK